MFTGTSKELADKLNVLPAKASALLVYLEAAKIAKRIGKQKSPSGKGIPAIVWELETPIIILPETTQEKV